MPRVCWPLEITSRGFPPTALAGASAARGLGDVAGQLDRGPVGVLEIGQQDVSGSMAVVIHMEV